MSASVHVIRRPPGGTIASGRCTTRSRQDAQQLRRNRENFQPIDTKGAKGHEGHEDPFGFGFVASVSFVAFVSIG